MSLDFTDLAIISIPTITTTSFLVIRYATGRDQLALIKAVNKLISESKPKVEEIEVGEGVEILMKEYREVRKAAALSLQQAAGLVFAVLGVLLAVFSLLARNWFRDSADFTGLSLTASALIVTSFALGGRRAATEKELMEDIKRVTEVVEGLRKATGEKPNSEE